MSADQQQLSALLSHLTGGANHTPTTEEIREAEKQLKPLLKKKECIPALVGLLGDLNQSPSIRQISAIVLRKRIASHYPSFAEADRADLRKTILQVLSTEPERSVRLSTCAVAASIARVIYTDGDPVGGWPDLLSYVNAAAGDASIEAREMAYSLLCELTDTVGDHLRPQFPALSQMYSGALLDTGNPRVQCAALKSLGQLVSYLSDETDEGEGNPIDHFAGLIPTMLNAGVECQKRGDDEEIMVLCDVLYDLVRCNAISVVQHMSSMVAFCAAAISDENLEMTARDSAALVIASYAEGKPKQLGRAGAIPNILDMLMGLIEKSSDSASGALFDSNPTWREDDDAEADEDFDGPTATSMAQGTLDMLACHIPMAFIFQPAIERVVVRLKSNEPAARKAGIASLGVIAEGCSEPIREHLAEVMGHVFAAAADPDPQVRECTCFALGQLAEHCRPEILEYADKVLPVTFGLLDDANAAVQTTSCYVLEMFCEQLEPAKVRPFLDGMVRKLVQMLETSTRRSVQEMSVAALAATAVAAEAEFTPYVPGVAAMLEKMMSTKDEKLIGLRGRSLECMGHIAIAVEKEVFRPYFVGTMTCACDGLTTDNTDLHEFAYAAFANLSKVMGEEFTPCIAELVPHLVKVIGECNELEEAEEKDQKENGFNLGDSDDEDDPGKFIMNVRTALIDTKKAAITAIGEIAAHTGPAFVPYLESTVDALRGVSGYWHPLVKAECAEALPSLLVSSIAANHNGKVLWVKGNTDGGNPMSEHTNSLCSAIMGLLTEMIADEEKEVVAKACEGIQQTIELCGPYALAPVANECLKRTLDLISLLAPCQQDDEEFDEEVDDHDSFMTSVTDLIGSFGRVMGQQFSQFVPGFLPPICNFCKPTRPASDRAMALGCLGEIVQEVGEGVSEHWMGVFFPAVLSGLADGELNVRRNSAFCAGACCKSFGLLPIPQYPQILTALSPLFVLEKAGPSGGVTDPAGACVDNAVAAVARMIMASPENVPVGQVLPTILANVPLRSDFSENETVYECLLGLLHMNHPDAVANVGGFKKAFTDASSPGLESVADEIKVKLTAALGAMQ
uniref:Importin N-terminal domain-containing protein n=2 Tax=Corethron hystrix TaxID=216773 RepID=A0A7S1BKP6_9STRA|mmetsp:Transcript_29401/g.67612  ORF Transcript_29401/g.67612 Transcript_29401/m.67612 type:complete len:1079 (+) Transcript_29401:286-3522(+)|eukprot:CAMPEP_0113309196 /NCGR_PEP_ID=MMETSP0010_2-20120614/7341_1 /TAXON_ID=216773 ORGANISM="Corethron hystrix, Strain 308" /NCGR_SAMPLE_ID=MMETSP0010_2 /ASSEMBLY_ACC=CAM_ASM_000155 /LENGTH=1078 /DNA_ID=CAMNT_0000164409 /DNA_START=176 /DNA_END=3412 /DNA_ORIENTATION=- /assembly_acc=CAM_ASM_000155